MIKLDYLFSDEKIIGYEHGLNINQEFLDYKCVIADIVTGLYNKKNIPGEGLRWMELGYSDETVWYVKEFASLVKGKFDNILVLGIGGSALGGLAVTEALLKPYWNLLSKEQRNDLPKIFFLDNIDADVMSSLFEILDWEKTLVNVITKSGSTAETMSQFMIVRDLMVSKLGGDYRNHIVATTDKHIGILRQIAEQEGYKTFDVPDDVGGPFTVFSAVGLLPFALLGLDVDSMLQGIKDLDIVLQSSNIFENLAAQNALIHYLMDVKKGKNHSVLMPYSSRLRYVPDWFIQLWAESLGKNKDRQGNSVVCGSTPLKALGATDQHSQLQLFNEGPNNKLINFIRVKSFDCELNIPEIYQYTGIGYLGGKSVNKLMDVEAEATKFTLADYKRPSVTILLEKLDAYNIAQLLYFLQVQTAIAGELYNIDTFSQLGVEQVKNYTYALMGRAGYEDSADSLVEKMNISY